MAAQVPFFNAMMPAVALNARSILSVSTSASALASAGGGWRGIYCNATASLTYVGYDGNSNTLRLISGATIWIQGAWCSQLNVAATNDLLALV